MYGVYEADEILCHTISTMSSDVILFVSQVFDEADEMLKADAFADDSVRLIKNIRKKNPSVQLLLFSATFNEPVKRFAMQVSAAVCRCLCH